MFAAFLLMYPAIIMLLVGALFAVLLAHALLEGEWTSALGLFVFCATCILIGNGLWDLSISTARAASQ